MWAKDCNKNLQLQTLGLPCCSTPKLLYLFSKYKLHNTLANTYCIEYLLTTLHISLCIFFSAEVSIAEYRGQDGTSPPLLVAVKQLKTQVMTSPSDVVDFIEEVRVLHRLSAHRYFHKQTSFPVTRRRHSSIFFLFAFLK